MTRLNPFMYPLMSECFIYALAPYPNGTICTGDGFPGEWPHGYITVDFTDDGKDNRCLVVAILQDSWNADCAACNLPGLMIKGEWQSYD